MKKPKVPLTQERVRELFDYDPETGIVTWRISVGRWKHIKPGTKVGSPTSDGYLEVWVDGRKYKLHRLIFLLMEGYFPEHQIDHINRIRDDNRWDNIREASPACNSRNTRLRSDNTSGVKGVSKRIRTNKWSVQIMVGESTLYYGTFLDLTEAVAHRLAAEQSMNWAGCESSSSAYLYMQKYLKGDL